MREMFRWKGDPTSRTQTKLGSLPWRASFERQLATRHRLAKLTRWKSVDAELPRFIDGNHGFYVHDGCRQLSWMLAAIDQAKKRVDFEMYIFERDWVGTEVRDCLVRAAKRGVVVRLLYDAVGCSGSGPGFFQPLVDAGGQVVEFNPVNPWRLRMGRSGLKHPWQPNHRDHRKLLVCDCPAAWVRRAASQGQDVDPPAHESDGVESAIAITGGRNVADQYLSRPITAGQWRDCGVVLFGPIAVRLGDMFSAMWEHARAQRDGSHAPQLTSAPVGHLAVLALGSQPGLMNLLQWSLSRLTSVVQKELRVSCAYFIPSSGFRRTLVSVARRRHPCKILIPLHSDIPIVGAASRHLLGMLLEAGVEIYRYSAQTLHEKTFVFDRMITVVGSSNVDQRSFKLNYELCVIVIGESFAAPVVGRHDADLEDSERYTLAAWRARARSERLVDWVCWLFRSQL